MKKYTKWSSFVIFMFALIFSALFMDSNTVKAKEISSDVLGSITLYQTFSKAADDNTVIRWKDPIIEHYIRVELFKWGGGEIKLTGNITIKDMKTITKVTIRDTGIKTLEDLKYCTNLEKLIVYESQISDISSLKGLTNLQRLELNDNNIKDITCISELINLHYLDMSGNQINNISGLEKLTNLTELNLSDNQIDDIGSLKNLVGLSYLNLCDNNISDIKELEGLVNIQTLRLGNNKIDDINRIEQMQKLRDLFLNGNNIQDISVVNKLHLFDLSLSNNKIKDISCLSISIRTDITYLDLSSNQISDVNSLANLICLNILYLDNNKISDISGFNKLIYLKYLAICNNQINDISSLKDLKNLGILVIEGNSIIDWTPVIDVPNVSARPDDTSYGVDNEIKNVSIHKIIIQTNSPYCEVTDSVRGDVQVLKKMDCSVTTQDGESKIPLIVAKQLGYDVVWEATTKTMTIARGERIVKIKAKSKTMSITEGGITTNVPMDVAMKLDAKGNYAITIADFGKAVDASTRWDKTTKTIGINSTQSEFVDVEKISAAEKELKYIGLEYVAGGEFMNVEDFNNPIEKHPVGAVVVYSSKSAMVKEKKLINKYRSKLQKQDLIYCISGKAYLIRAQEYSDGSIRDLVYKLDTFSIENESARVIYLQGSPKYTIEFDYIKGKLVATDGLKIMAVRDNKTKNFVELDEYEMLGNAEQRIRKRLYKCIEGYAVNNDGEEFHNPLGLDVDEVEKYSKTGNDSNCKTFKVMENAKGEPAFFVNTSEKYGLNDDSLKYMQQAIDRFNVIDPELIDTITNRYGLTCVTYDMAGPEEGVFRGKGWSGSYNTYLFGNVVFFNQYHKFYAETINPIFYRAEIGYNLLVESRAVYYREMDWYEGIISEAKEDFFDKAEDNEEADKYDYALALIDKWYKERLLTWDEYTYWTNNASASLNAYYPSYKQTWFENIRYLTLDDRVLFFIRER